jgi:hypothetical protein
MSADQDRSQKPRAGFPLPALRGHHGVIDPEAPNGRHATQSGSRSPLTFGPCSNTSQAISGFPVQLLPSPRLSWGGPLLAPLKESQSPSGSRCPGGKGNPARPLAPGGRRQQLRPQLKTGALDTARSPHHRFLDDPTTAQPRPLRIKGPMAEQTKARAPRFGLCFARLCCPQGPAGTTAAPACPAGAMGFHGRDGGGQFGHGSRCRNRDA